MPPNYTADNTIEKNQNNENNIDVQVITSNKPDYQINANNFEQSPAPLSREQILSTPNSNNIPQPTINNQFMNGPGQFQQVPIVNPSLVANQMYPQNPNVIIIHQVAPVPLKIYNNRYQSTSLTCPYCQKNVSSVPITTWSCKSCEQCFCIMFAYIVTLGLCIFLDLCFLTCSEGDYCCCEAIHKCPYCNRIIAQRDLDKRFCR